ncbi:MAG: CsgG/HfaB family protein [Candidatus Aminicenantes bacterium]|jgi:curli biogenesis system outer membrane secretion channel CsgG
MRKKISIAVLAVFLGLISVSCGPGYIYKDVMVNPRFDNSFIEKIAVLEFSNYSINPNAGKIIADSVEQFLINNSKYTVISRMELNHILREHNLSARGILSSDTAKNIGRLAGVDALIVGNVQDYSIKTISWSEREGANLYYVYYKRIANVAFTYKVLNTTTGEVVWSDNAQGQNWRQAEQRAIKYLDEISEYEYFKGAINNAMDYLKSLFPHKSRIKVRAGEK